MEQNMNSGSGLNVESVSRKNLIIFIVIGLVLVLISLGVWYWETQRIETIAPVEAPVDTQPAVENTPALDINQELESIEVNNLDKDFQKIDSDINSL